MSRLVNLDVAAAEFANRLVAEGRYASVDDVVREAMAVFLQKEAEERLEKAIIQGLDDVDAGRTVPIEDVFDRLLGQLAARADQH